MRILRRFQVLLVVVALASIGLAGSAGFTGSWVPTSTTHVAVLGSTMLGANEVPGPGDPNASGSTVIALNSNTGTVCFVIRVSGLSAPITKGHIHVGPAGVAGPVVIPFPLTGGPSAFAGCTHADPELVQNIINNPSGYYTNVHNAPFPAGAMRGQLQSLVPSP